jgi:tRNA threonylcarbamoyl adenosine modification protein YeaZ
MILVIDTSSSMAVLATIDDETGRLSETFLSSRDPELIPFLRRTARFNTITKVAVATGPGSFTGLRVGVSFGLGLAKGLGVPIVPLPSLQLQAARSDEPVIAVSDAGRGRFYYLVPGKDLALGEAGEIPRTHPLVGRVLPEREASLRSAGHVFKPEIELRSTARAAQLLLESAREVAYGSLRLEYMQSFSARA